MNVRVFFGKAKRVCHNYNSDDKTQLKKLHPNISIILAFIKLYHEEFKISQHTNNVCVHVWTIVNFLELVADLSFALSEWPISTNKVRSRSAVSIHNWFFVCNDTWQNTHSLKTNVPQCYIWHHYVPLLPPVFIPSKSRCMPQPPILMKNILHNTV
jgi:hypothetical protein